MSIEVAMESQKFMEAGRVICVCCLATTYQGSEGCCRCQMPLAISEAMIRNEVKPLFLPVVGLQGVGKTTYTGMLLEMLLKGGSQLSASTKYAATKAIQRETLTSLCRRRFPKPTGKDVKQWNWVQCELDYEGRPDLFDRKEMQRRKKRKLSENPGLNWISPELSGESLERELRHSGSFPVIGKCVNQAQGILLLVDATTARDPAFTGEDELVTQLIQYLRKNARSTVLRECVAVPLAIVFTKTDLCPEASLEPAIFAESYLPSFYATVDESFANHRFFATQVVGGVAQVNYNSGGDLLPMHVQPRGVVEPLAWLVKPDA